MFEHLRTLRPWGPEDRIPNETIVFWREEIARDPRRPVRTEVELWFHENQERRHAVFETFSVAVQETHGTVIDHAVIPEIAYDGALVDIPSDTIQGLIERQHIRLALTDEVMFLRPQAILGAPVDLEPLDEDIPSTSSVAAPRGEPIGALLDGVPLQGHVRLADRLIIDDPEDLSSRALVSRRAHGTAMASLILHGDLNRPEPSLDRPLYVRPVMQAPAQGDECTSPDRLLVDTFYLAIRRMKEGDVGGPAVAPSVFLVNLSMADPRRPFSGPISPWARLLDYLADRFNILFLVSAGNILEALRIAGVSDWTTFERAGIAERERFALLALDRAKHERTLLSPAEALNPLTIGAAHHDDVVVRVGSSTAVDPLDGNDLPNLSSALGLGHRKVVKPEIFFPGGREHIRPQSTGGGLLVQISPPQRLYGLRAAAPDTSGLARLDVDALTSGTSAATALATRAGHQIFDALMDRQGGSMHAEMDPTFYAVVTKALLVHRARWTDKARLLEQLFGPHENGKHNERRDNVSRVLGFGRARIAETIACTSNRATLVGYGAVSAGSADAYRIPLPACLERVTVPRLLTVTVAWFSPVRVQQRAYRCAKVEAAPIHAAIEVLGVKRAGEQPADPTVGRGTVFHEHYHGQRAVPFLDAGHLALRVWCREQATGVASPIRYGLAVTLEADAEIPIYEQIRDRLRPAIVVPAS
jgi:hypothetical protein